MSEELKACPFCGDIPDMMSNLAQNEWYVYCKLCDVSMPIARTECRAIAAWNLRIPDWRELAEEARKAIANFMNCIDDDGSGEPVSTEPLESFLTLADEAGLLEE